MSAPVVWDKNGPQEINAYPEYKAFWCLIWADKEIDDEFPDPWVIQLKTGEYIVANGYDTAIGEEEKIAGPFDTLEEAQAVAMATFRLGGSGE